MDRLRRGVATAAPAADTWRRVPTVPARRDPVRQCHQHGVRAAPARHLRPAGPRRRRDRPGAWARRTGGTRCCFATRACDSARPGQWCIVAPDPATTTISGSFVFEDGSPAPATRFVLIAPDGEYLAGERQSAPDRGEGVSARAGDDGRFSFPQAEDRRRGHDRGARAVRGPARRASPPAAAKGNVVCARVAAGGGSIDIVLSPVGPAAPPANPRSRRPHRRRRAQAPHEPCARGRQPRRHRPFTGTGRLTNSNQAAVKLFTAAAGGTEVTFNGTDDVFTGQQLVAGVQLFAEAAASPSAAPTTSSLTLTLTGGASPVGPPATATMTSVELTLDICAARPAVGDPPPLSQADKINPGAFVGLQDAGNLQQRAMLIVRPPVPGGFTGDVSIARVDPLDTRVALFADEIAAAGQAPQALPRVAGAARFPRAGCASSSRAPR